MSENETPAQTSLQTVIGDWRNDAAVGWTCTTSGCERTVLRGAGLPCFECLDEERKGKARTGAVLQND